MIFEEGLEDLKKSYKAKRYSFNRLFQITACMVKTSQENMSGFTGHYYISLPTYVLFSCLLICHRMAACHTIQTGIAIVQYATCYKQYLGYSKVMGKY